MTLAGTLTMPRSAAHSAPTNRPLRVLLIAEMCNPTWPSVPLVGYGMARALAERADLEVTLVTHVRNRPTLEGDPLIREAGHVCFLDNEFIARPMHRLARLLRGGDKLAWTVETAMQWPGYVVFEHLVARRFGRDLDRGRFDLIHRLTPLTPTIPSPLARRTDVPMVLGPLNGGLPWPSEHPELRRREREWLAPLRKCYRLMPYYRSTYRHVAGVIAGSRHTASEIPPFFRGLRCYLPENGISTERFPSAMRWPEPAGRFRFITVARLVPFKGVHFILEAMSGSPLLRRCDLAVIGDGPERAALEAFVRQQGLEGTVRFLGWLDHADIAREMERSQAFVLPSLREFGGGAVLEAMASALPPIVIDYGGPGELVTSETGIRLPMTGQGTLPMLLREAMVALAGDPERCRRMGAAAARAVRERHLWPAKAERVAQFYREVLRRTAATRG
jgi:glycosyltransferase involved in cell wall biosynthesis